MDFPFGHNRHHHSRPESDPNQDPYSSDPYPNSTPNPYADPNPYPPPSHNPYGYQPPPPPVQHVSREYGYQPPPPPVQHVSHEYGYQPPPPPVQHVSHEYGYQPQPPPVQHVAHDYGRPDFSNEHGRPEFGNEYGRPTPPVQHVAHEVGSGGYGSSGYGSGGYGSGGYGNEMGPAGGGSAFGSSATHVDHVSHENQMRPGPAPAGLPRQRTVRVYTMGDERYSLSIRDGKVVLAPANPADEHQHWIKDMKYSTRVKDEESQPSFALVNKATGEAIKHAVGANHPVRLVPYNPNYLDESVLWAESKDTGQGFRCIRMVNNIRLNFDAFNGDKEHGGIRDGTTIVLWEWLEGKNQRWKIVPYSD